MESPYSNLIWLFLALGWIHVCRSQLRNLRTQSNADKFVIDHMGRMQTTLSPKEQKEVSSLGIDNYYDETFSSQDDPGDRDYKDEYTDYQADKTHSSRTSSTSSSSSPGQASLREKCASEGGSCTSFNGCNTVSHIYKGYCSTDYSSVCCVDRGVICEKNDGICTDDREACVAAGEIMNKKYNLMFYTWMECNSTHVCCRPSRKTNIFSVVSSPAKSSTSSLPGKSSSAGNDSMRQKSSGNKKERASVSSRNNARQLGQSKRKPSIRKDKISKSRLSRLSHGTGMAPMPGFPQKDVVSPEYEDYQEEKKRPPSRKSVQKKTSGSPSRSSRRPSRRVGAQSERTPGFGLSPLQTLLSSYPGLLYNSQPALPNLAGYTSPFTGQIHAGQPQAAGQQQAAYSPYQSHAVNAVALAQGMPVLPHSIAKLSRAEYLGNYHNTDMSSAYSSSVRNPLFTQGVPQNTGQVASPSSLFGNIYLKR